MNFIRTFPKSVSAFRRSNRGGFSIIEVIVVVGLMSFIVFGLVLMFTQTQRAYKLGTTEVDMMQSGRATIDLIGRELSVITPSRGSNVVNFHAEIPNPAASPPLRQLLPGSALTSRTNVIHDLYFLTRDNQNWAGIGYHVGDRQAGVGTLYRYEGGVHYPKSPEPLFDTFSFLALNDINTNLNRIMDGVVHFRVSAYSIGGFWITNEFGKNFETNIALAASTLIPGEVRYFGFYSNLVPAAVELELGVLEDATLAKAKAIGDVNRRYDYLTNQANHVHLFRVRVPVRNVDPSAYP